MHEVSQFLFCSFLGGTKIIYGDLFVSKRVPC